MTIDADKQSSAPGRLVVLFVLDCTQIGGDVYRFCSSAHETQSVLWGGYLYLPVPIDADGFDVNGRGALPQPKLRISNAMRLASALTQGMNDLLGATVTRYKTFERYLDGGATPDSSQHFPPDIFKVERKSAQNRVFVEWELSAAMDHEGKMLPGRQVVRDSCDHRYRRWSGTSFDYSKATCPYTDAYCFDANGMPVTLANDKCGKRLSDCELRFGKQPLPFRGFPMVARIRL